MKVFFRIILILFLALIIIQVIPSGKPENNPVQGKDIFELNKIPGDVGLLLKNGCYDCHSQTVNYPWYSYVAPVSWLVASDVKTGRANLDFGLWGDLGKKDQLKLLSKISDEVDEGTMPMPVYLIMHPEARLTSGQRELIIKWTEELAESML